MCPGSSTCLRPARRQPPLSDRWPAAFFLLGRSTKRGKLFGEAVRTSCGEAPTDSRRRKWRFSCRSSRAAPVASTYRKALDHCGGWKNSRSGTASSGTHMSGPVDRSPVIRAPLDVGFPCMRVFPIQNGADLGGTGKRIPCAVEESAPLSQRKRGVSLNWQNAPYATWFFRALTTSRNSTQGRRPVRARPSGWDRTAGRSRVWANPRQRCCGRRPGSAHRCRTGR